MYNESKINQYSRRYENVQTARDAAYSTYIKDILLLPNLKKLKLCFSNISNHDKKSLVSRAVRLRMQQLSMVDYNAAIDSTFLHSSKEVENLSARIRQLNLQRHRTLLQTMVLLRTMHLRRMSTIFLDNLLEYLG